MCVAQFVDLNSDSFKGIGKEVSSQPGGYARKSVHVIFHFLTRKIDELSNGRR